MKNENDISLNYTKISNVLILDRTIPSLAFHIMTYLLSKPKGWRVLPSDISREFNRKKDCIYKMLSRLQTEGYITRHQEQGGASGFGPVVYTIHGIKTEGENTGSGKTRNRKKPAHTNTILGSKKEEYNKTRINNPPNPPKGGNARANIKTISGVELEKKGEKSAALEGLTERAKSQPLGLIAPTQAISTLMTQAVKTIDTGGSSPTEAIFAHWQRVMNHPRAKLDDKRKRLITARLKDGYTEGDIIQAINGCATTPFNLGMNANGQRYDDISLICRDAEHIDRFIYNDRHPPSLDGAEEQRRKAKRAMISAICKRDDAARANITIIHQKSNLRSI